jgi:hypothetical protein
VVKEFPSDDGRFTIKSDPRRNNAGKWCIGIRVFDDTGGVRRVSEEGPAEGPEDCHGYDTEDAAHEAGVAFANERIRAGDVTF